MASYVRARIARLLLHIVGRIHGPIEVAIKGRDALALFLPDRRLVLPAVAGGAPDDDGGDGDGGDDASADAGSDDAGDDDGADGEDGGDDDGGDGDDDATVWRRHARKHERRAKKLDQQVATLNAELEKLKGANKSAQEKAVEQAKKEAREEALAEAAKERRADRLEVAVTRQAAKGVKVGKGDKAKTLKFADPEDALVHVERMIARGDVDEDDVFDDDGKVKGDGLRDALAQLLNDKPHLIAGGADDEKPKGESDAGKGSGSGATDAQDMNEFIRRQHRRG